MTLFRFTVRSSANPPTFDASAFVLPFDGRLEADEFAAEILKKFAFFGPFDHPCEISLHVSPVAYRAHRGARGTREMHAQ